MPLPPLLHPDPEAFRFRGAAPGLWRDRAPQDGTGPLGRGRRLTTLARAACPGPDRPWRGERARMGLQYCLLDPGGAAEPSLPGSKGNCGMSPVMGPDNHDPGGGSNIWTLRPQCCCQFGAQGRRLQPYLLMGGADSVPSLVRSGPGPKQGAKSHQKILPVLLSGCVTSGKALLLSESHFLSTK